MNRNRLFIGISSAAFAAAAAAGPAAAQTQTGNCTAPAGSTAGTSPGGTCTVDNRAPGNDNSSSFIFQRGEGNVATATQRGDDHISVIEQDGVSNDATHDQAGNDHYADTDQAGDDNLSFIVQRDRDNTATIVQEGDNNRFVLGQGTSFSGDPDTEAGENNVASVTMRGDSLTLNSVHQGRATFGQGPADDNVMTITMTGVRNAGGNIHQLSRGNVLRMSLSGGGVNDSTGTRGNTSSVLQNNPFYQQNDNGEFVAAFPTPANNPFSGNVTDVAITGQQNRSSVQQNGVLNSVIVSMLGGGPDPSSSATPSPSGGTLPAGRIQGNRSDISQSGRGNVAAISSGGLGGQGNVSRIEQGNAGASNLGVNNTAYVWQRGILDSSTIRQDNNMRGPAGAVQSGSFADLSQRSLNSTSYVEQVGTNSATVSQALNSNGTGGDNTLRLRQQDAGEAAGPGTGTGGPFDPTTPTTVASRNTAAVSQAGIDNDITIDQDAINATAIAWQQLGSRGNGVEIEQGTGAQAGTPASNNAQDGAGVGSAGGFLSTGAPAGAGNTGSNAINLTADVTQLGRGSTARVRQDGQELSFLATQAGTATDAGGAAIDSGNVLLVSQINAYNSATVSQNGFRLEAAVDQRGTGGFGSDDVLRRNLVTIQQTGDSHRAIARQLETVNPSGPNNTANTAAPAAGDPNDPAFRFERAAGRQSAEIQIIQRGSVGTTGATANGNDAFVEQAGDGQFARIEQEGRNNNAGIQQQEAAVNAVAVIEQFGNGNSFFITQNAPGQYMQVRQVGNNNVSTTSVAGPTSGTGGTGTETAPAFFPFAP